MQGLYTLFQAAEDNVLPQQLKKQNKKKGGVHFVLIRRQMSVDSEVA